MSEIVHLRHPHTGDVKKIDSQDTSALLFAMGNGYSQIQPEDVPKEEEVIRGN